MAVRHVCVPGEWFAILGPRTSVMLAPGERSRVAGLWELVESGAGFDETLDALIAQGLRDLTGFVLVGFQDDVTRVIVRGAAVATSGGVTLDGSAATTWTEATCEAGLPLRVEVGGSRHSVEEPIVVGTGLVKVSIVDFGVASQAPALTVVPTLAAEEAPAYANIVDLPVDLPVELAADVPAEDEAVTDPDLATGWDQDLTDAFAGADPLGDVASPDDLLTEAFPLDAFAPAPVVEPVVPVVAPVPPVDLDRVFGARPVAPAFAGSDDETATDVHPVVEEPVVEQPVAQEPPTPRPVVRLVLSSGTTHDVDGVMIFGRAPQARWFSSDHQPQLVEVPSPNMEISSTHLEVRPGVGTDEGSAIATDLNSTNGTVVVQPGGRPQELTPGVGVKLEVGAVVDLGDGLTIQVVAP